LGTLDRVRWFTCDADAGAAMLSGCRVLVVEDEPVIAEDLCSTLTTAEAIVIGPVASVGEARRILKGGTAVDAALLDVNLSDGEVTPVIEALRARKVPVVIYTGGSLPERVLQRHPDLIALSKPIMSARLIGELRRAWKQPAA
jgi:DNA-binding NtrC family response regulator